MTRLLIRRAGAHVVDIVLLFSVLFPVGQLVRFAIGWQPPVSPTGLAVWLASALNFSLPTWRYFVLSDSSVRGATIGKSLLHVTGSRVGVIRALGRTAVKLLPWETTHLSAFALSAEPAGPLNRGQLMGLTIAVAQTSLSPKQQPPPRGTITSSAAVPRQVDQKLLALDAALDKLEQQRWA